MIIALSSEFVYDLVYLHSTSPLRRESKRKRDLWYNLIFGWPRMYTIYKRQYIDTLKDLLIFMGVIFLKEALNEKEKNEPACAQELILCAYVLRKGSN